MADENKNNYYDLLKNESYKTMLNSQIQASVARDQALKYTQNAINNNGYGSQGLSQTAYNGISANYMNALQQANATHQSDLNSINDQQRQEQVANDNSRFETLTTYMNNASDIDQLNNIMQNYGISYNGDTNTLDYAKGSEFMSDQNKQDLSVLYNLYKDNYEKQDQAQYTITDYGTAKDIVKDQKGDTGKLNDELSHLLDDTYMKRNHNVSWQNGDVVKVSQNSNNHTDVRYAYLIYKNGAWRVATQQEYNNAQNQYWFRSSDNSNSTYNLALNGKPFSSSTEIK